MGQAERKEQIYLQLQDGRALCSRRATGIMGATEVSFESSPNKTN